MVLLQGLDRVQLSLLLDSLQHIQLPGGVRARAPRYLQVQEFTAAGLADRLKAAGDQTCELHLVLLCWSQ